MTAMSKAVVASEPGRLHESLSKISEELPIHRRDEVGDIARSSKVLFAAVIDSHKELDPPSSGPDGKAQFGEDRTPTGK